MNTAKKYSQWAFLIFILLCLVIWLWPVSAPFKQDYSVVVCDDKNEVLSIYLNKKEQWHFAPDSTQAIPTKLYQAILHYEDRYFESHLGINPISIIKALYHNLKQRRIVSGASTITMQVARMSNPQPRTFFNKIKEMIHAVRLERVYSKEALFKLYINHAPYGGNIVGYKAAAWHYFGIAPNKLTWAQAATLAVLPNAPAQLTPKKNPMRLREKRNRLLYTLYAHNIISKTRLTLALAEPIPTQSYPFPKKAPHFSHFVKGKKPQKFYHYTTLNSAIQSRGTQILEPHKQLLQNEGIHNVAAIIADSKTGAVLGYWGSQDFWQKEFNGMVDGVQAPRSSGSVLKPFLYALAMDEGLIAPLSKMHDIPSYFTTFAPRNADKEFRGLVRAEQALIRSLNIPAVRLLNSFGYNRFYYFLKQAGLKNLFREPDAYGLPLILGGAEITLWDLAQLYTALAGNGTFSSLTYTKKEQKKVLANQLISPGAISLTRKILKDVKRPGNEFYWEQYNSNWPMAWKTGTSYGHRDAWAVGVSPQYTIAVWVGNFSGAPNPGLSGAKSAGPILFNLFNSLPKESRLRWFKQNITALKQVELCSWSGFSAGENCVQTSTKEMPVGSKPLPICPWHKKIFLDKEKQYEVCSRCWGSQPYQVVKKLQVNAEVLKFLPENSLTMHTMLHNPACPAVNPQPAISIIYPAPNTHVFIPRDYSGGYQKMTVQAAHQQKNSTIYWYLDERYIGKTHSKHVMGIIPENGKHTLVLVDAQGNKVERVFYTRKK